jgi:hypothetical protein
MRGNDMTTNKKVSKIQAQLELLKEQLKEVLNKSDWWTATNCDTSYSVWSDVAANLKCRIEVLEQEQKEIDAKKKVSKELHLKWRGKDIKFERRSYDKQTDYAAHFLPSDWSIYLTHYKTNNTWSSAAADDYGNLHSRCNDCSYAQEALDELTTELDALKSAIP